MSIVTEQTLTPPAANQSQDVEQNLCPLITEAYDQITGILHDFIQTQHAHCPPILIQSPQGFGKTQLLDELEQHFLALSQAHSAISLEKNPRQIPIELIRLKEFEYGIRSFQGLYLRLQDLNKEKGNPAIPPWPDSNHGLNDNNASTLAFIRKIRRREARLILLVDNLDVLTNQLDKVSYKFFVKLFGHKITKHFIMIATSAQPLAMADKAHVIHLKKPDPKRAFQLFKKQCRQHNPAQLALVDQKQGALAALTLITQANRRSLLAICESLLMQPESQPDQHLRHLLAESHPYFDSRMQQLPAQQQHIIHALAHQWRAVKVANIAMSTGLISKTISAQLHQIEKQAWVEKIPSSNKNHYYQLTDPIFQLSYLMRFSSQAQQAELARCINLIGYVMSSPVDDAPPHNEQSSEQAPSRLATFAYLKAIEDNHDVSEAEVEALFNHAMQMPNGISGQAYCDSASHFFKRELPGERLTFLITAASRGYEQAYLGLISLLDLAKDGEQRKAAFVIKTALCQQGIELGFALKPKLIQCYLQQGEGKKACFDLSESLNIETKLDTEAATEKSHSVMLLKSICALWYGEASLAKAHLAQYLKQYTKGRSRQIMMEDALLCEFMLLLMAKEEWDYLVQLFATYSHLKSDFLPLYTALFAFKPILSASEKDAYCAMPATLKALVPAIQAAVMSTKNRYDNESEEA